MTDDFNLGSVTSPAEFESALAAVVEAAVTSGVDVRGAWEFQTRGSTHNWEINVTELAKRSDDESDSEER